MVSCFRWFFFLCITSFLFASDLYDDKRVSQIEVIAKGTGAETQIDPKPVLARMKTREGDPFSQLTFDSDLKALSQEYEHVEPVLQLKGDQVAITLYITPRPLIHQIVWSGNQKFKTSRLQEELDIKPGTLFHRQEFNKAFNKVREFYFKKGYFEAQLSYTLEPLESTNQVDVLITVNEGRAGYIQKIELRGFTKKEKNAIEEEMHLKKYNFLTSWFTGTGTYRDEAMEQDRMTILNYLHNEGYADARVDIEVREDPVTGKLIIEITAERGVLFHFGEVTFSGNELISTEELMKKSQVVSGAPFSPDKVRETAQVIKDLYGQKGYIDASVQYEMLLCENEPIFNVDFTIEEGGEYRVGLIHIFGNTSTKSHVILRESLLVPGETFDSRKLKATQQRLEAIGYFKSVNVYAVRCADDEALGDNYRDVFIEVEETTTGNVSLFAGFNSSDSVSGGLELTERNFNIAGVGKALTGHPSALRGGGEFFHIRGTLGLKQNNILVSWMNPYLNDTLWRFGVEVSRTYSKLQKDVSVVTYGGSVYTSYPLSTFWSAGMRQRFRHSKDDLFIQPLGNTPQAIASVANAKEKLDQKGLISAFSGNVSYDSTNSAMKPHRGWRSYLEAEVAGVGGNYDFLKLSYLNSIYFPVWSKGTLKLRGDFKFIVPFGKTDRKHVPYSERFFLGGEGTVRGYKPYLLGPVVRLLNNQYEWQPTKTPYGGLSSALVSLEYNQELLRMLDAFAFVDVGIVDFGLFKLSHVRPTTGVGLRLDLGNRAPMMAGIGVPLVRKDRHNGKWQKFFFSMGGQF